MDFTQYEIPREPPVAFLYNPSSEAITAALAGNIASSLAENPGELWVIYVTPTYNVFEGGQPMDLRKVKVAEKYTFSVIRKDSRFEPSTPRLPPKQVGLRELTNL